jgi:hypothetical protein
MARGAYLRGAGVSGSPVLTLHHGEAHAEYKYTEHPIEVARKALMAAADLETGAWAEVLRRFASTLPHRCSARRELR